jgi:hypothetical protein
MFLSSNKKRFNIKAIYVSFVFMVLLIISILRSLDTLIINDLFELGKPIYFFSFFAMGYAIHWNYKKTIKYFSCLMLFLLFGALIGIGEGITNSIDALTSILYKEKREVWYHKAIFSFISPYVFATVLLLPIFYNIIRLMKPRNKLFIADMIKLSIFLYCLVLTQSRTIFISFVLSFAILFLLILLNKWYPERYKIILLFICMVVAIFILIQYIIAYAEKRLNYLYAGLNVVIKQLNNFSLNDFVYSNPSTTHRFDQILFAIKHQDTIPLFGVGIGKAVLSPETFYAMYYYRTGLIGVCLHFGLIFYTIHWALYFTKKYAVFYLINDNYFSMMAIFFTITIYFISFFFDYLSSATNDQTRSGFIFYVLIAMVSYYKKHFKLKIA